MPSPTSSTLVSDGCHELRVASGSAQASVVLTGASQRLSVPLPELRLAESGCPTDGLELRISLSEFAGPKPGRAGLAPRALRLGSGGSVQPLESADEPGGWQAQVALSSAAGSALQPVIELDLPANAYAGQYVATWTASLAETASAPQSPSETTAKSAEKSSERSAEKSAPQISPHRQPDSRPWSRPTATATAIPASARR
jgi:hypothetical protein